VTVAWATSVFDRVRSRSRYDVALELAFQLAVIWVYLGDAVRPSREERGGEPRHERGRIPAARNF